MLSFSFLLFTALSPFYVNRSVSRDGRDLPNKITSHDPLQIKVWVTQVRQRT